MKKFMLVALMMINFSLLRAQNVFDTKEPLTWLGLDFSQLKFILSDEAITEEDLKDKYFQGWNDLVLNEPKKYDVAKATSRKSVENYVDEVIKINKSASGPFIVDDANQFEHLRDSDIHSVVNKYNFNGKTGLGLLFIVESMDKNRKKASIWVTFVDMGSKKVLLAKPVEGESGGFGFRNYWAASFYKVMKDLPKNMKKWEKGE